MSGDQFVGQQTGSFGPIITPWPGGSTFGTSGSVDLLAGTTRIDDPASLKQAGHGALELAGSLNSASRYADDTTATAASALKGANWSGSLGNAMSQALDTWHQQSHALVQTCRDIHAKCTATADNYTQTEAANADSMSAVRQQSPFG